LFTLLTSILYQDTYRWCFCAINCTNCARVWFITSI